jgi:hypothetical protein
MPLAFAAPLPTWSVELPRVLGRALRKECDRAHPAEMATQEQLMLARVHQIARQRHNYRARRQALLDAFPYLAQRKVSLHRAGASCATLDRWRYDDDTARGATDNLRAADRDPAAVARGVDRSRSWARAGQLIS